MQNKLQQLQRNKENRKTIQNKDRKRKEDLNITGIKSRSDMTRNHRQWKKTVSEANVYNELRRFRRRELGVRFK